MDIRGYLFSFVLNILFCVFVIDIFFCNHPMCFLSFLITRSTIYSIVFSNIFFLLVFLYHKPWFPPANFTLDFTELFSHYRGFKSFLPTNSTFSSIYALVNSHFSYGLCMVGRTIYLCIPHNSLLFLRERNYLSTTPIMKTIPLSKLTFPFPFLSL